MEKEIVKEYSNGDLAVIWKPKKCIHAGICVKTLPEVYDPNGKPWIKAQNASIAKLKSQIAKCPSGALTYRMKGEKLEEENPETECTVVENGPLLVTGTLKVTLINGNSETKNVPRLFVAAELPPTNPTVMELIKK